jgi:citrate lyase beta subunit
MLIVSQNISNHNITFNSAVIYRINLAWINNLQELEALLKKHDKQKIFLDLPVSRIKPPNNKYSLDGIIPILNSYENIRYFAISNVNNANDLESYNDLIPKNITIIPKIESPDGITNVSEIVKAIPGQEKILMLDHDDLFSTLTKLGEQPSKFKDYINELVQFCKENNITLLRTIGVIFSDEEKRITEYIN